MSPIPLQWGRLNGLGHEVVLRTTQNPSFYWSYLSPPIREGLSSSHGPLGYGSQKQELGEAETEGRVEKRRLVGAITVRLQTTMYTTMETPKHIRTP